MGSHSESPAVSLARLHCGVDVGASAASEAAAAGCGVSHDELPPPPSLRCRSPAAERLPDGYPGWAARRPDFSMIALLARGPEGSAAHRCATLSSAGIRDREQPIARSDGHQRARTAV